MRSRQIRFAFTLLATCVAGALLWVGLAAATSTSSTNNAAHRHALRVHSAHRWHAERVHSAHVWHAERVHAAAVRQDAIDDYMVAVAYRVSICEEGGNWHYVGTQFDGGIGFMPATWQMFKTPSDPYWMHDATPLEQAQALFRLVAHYGIAMPDQDGCTGGY